MTAAYSEFIESVASVVVQTAARQFLAKLRVRRLREKRYASRKSPTTRGTLAKSVAARTVAARMKANTSRQHSNVVKVDMFTLAAIRIQAAYRGWYARDCIAIDKYCATIIQKNFRRKTASNWFATCVHGVVKIQSAFRAYEVRKSLTEHNHGSSDIIYNMAATVIQAQWRCFKCEMDFLRVYEDILLVQSVARGWITRFRVRSWMRKHNVQSSRSLKQSDSSSRKKTLSSHAYKLPHGYHNHTAFMKQSLPSPVRKDHSMKSQQQRRESAHAEPNLTRHLDISIDSSEDGLIEIYHNNVQEQKYSNDATGEQSKTQPRARDAAPFDEGGGDQGNTWAGRGAKFGIKGRMSALEQARGRVVSSSSHDETISHGKASASHSIARDGHAFVPAKSVQPGLRNSTSFDAIAKQPATVGRQPQAESFGKTGGKVVDSRPGGGNNIPAQAEIDATHLATASSVLAGWRSREKRGSNFKPATNQNSPARGNETNSVRPEVEYSGSFDLVSRTAAAPPASQVQSIGTESAALSKPQPDYARAESEQKEDATASNIHTAWRNREKNGGSFGPRDTSASVIPSTRNSNSTTSGNETNLERPVVAYSGSFDLAAKKQTKATASEVRSVGTNDVTLSDPNPDLDCVSSEQKEHATASNVLAGWRNREKKGSSFDQSDTPVDINNPSPGSIKKPAWLAKLEEKGKGHVPGGALEQPAKVKPSWQKNRSGLSLSKSQDESHFPSQQADNSTQDKSFGTQLRSMGHELQDEKKEDVAVSSSVTALPADQTQYQQPDRPSSSSDAIQPERSTGLDDSGPAKVSPVNISEQAVQKRDSIEPSQTSVDPLKSKSTTHMKMRTKRSSSEQQRIDGMHQKFIRAGLMGRAEKEKISFASMTSAEYEGQKMEQGGDYEPTASDLIHAWKGVNQTQPEMRGKLF
jgi:hypothetical protein